jgi:hypothetical protein
MSAISYTIAAEILLKDSMSGVLGLISQRLLGIHTKIGEVGEGFNKWKLALYGAGAGVAAGGIIAGMAEIAKHGTEVLDQTDKMIRQGRTQAEIAQTISRYWKEISHDVPEVNQSEFMRDVSVAKMRLGEGTDISTAIEVAKHAAMGNALINNATGSKSDDSVDAIVRAGELAGYGADPEKLIHFIDEMTRSFVAFAGKVSPETYLGAALTGGIAYKNLSEQAKEQDFFPLVGEMGTRAGNALAQVYGFLKGQHQMDRMQVETGEQLGLFGEEDLVKSPTGWRLKAGAMKGSQEYNENPLAWLHEVVKPAVDNYLKDHPDLSPGDVISKLFKNQSQLRAAANYMYDENYKTLQNEIANRNKSMDAAGQHQHFIDNNPKGVEQAYEAQKEAMLSAMGAPLMQMAIPIMKAVTSMFTSIGEFASAHPVAIQTIAVGIASLAAALAVLSVVALSTIAAAFMGMAGSVAGVAAGLTAIATALGALAVINWKAISDGVSGFFGAIKHPSPSMPDPGGGFDLGDLKHPSSYHGDTYHGDDHKSFLQSTSLFPQRDTKPIMLTANLQIDGATLAKTVDEHLAQSQELADSADTGNGVAMLALNGWNSIG